MYRGEWQHDAAGSHPDFYIRSCLRLFIILKALEPDNCMRAHHNIRPPTVGMKFAWGWGEAGLKLQKVGKA